jgi:D-aspartate ligase
MPARGPRDLSSARLPPAVVLGGEVIGLSVARSLSRAGVPVYALGHAADPVRHSRHRVEFVDVGRGEEVQRRYLEWLQAGPREGVVLPCYDEALELVADNRAQLGRLGYQTIEADDAVLLAMLDKARTYEIARQTGTEAPRHAVVSSLQDGRAAASEIGYPCAAKPVHSHLFARHFGLLKKAFVVGDQGELDAALAQALERGLAMMVTEIIPGPDWSFSSYYTYLDGDGEPLLHLTKRKLRVFPTGFGLGTYQVTEWIPEVAELGLRFLRGAGVRGLACVEFKRDARDGRLKLIECNHRFTAANEQLRACGMDLALFTYCRVCDLPTPRVDSYRQGVGLWYPLRDVRAFLAYRRAGELGFREWLRSLLRPQCFPVASFTDPMPTVAEGGRRAGRLVLRLARADRRSPG